MAVGTALAIGAGISAIGGAVASNQAKKAAKKASREKTRAEAKVQSLVDSRQDVINPYETTKDLSQMMSNPFQQLGVATQAAEIQMEQTDIALANTLDTLMATGASAGGATALAQAALQSKKGIAASIEQQEAQNEKARAQGEATLQVQKVAEQQRVQAAEAAGKQFQFQTEENRINADLDRASGQERQAQANVAAANQAKASAISGAFGGVTGMIGSAAGGGAFNK